MKMSSEYKYEWFGKGVVTLTLFLLVIAILGAVSGWAYPQRKRCRGGLA